MTIYEELKAAGCTLDNHCSDLYVKRDETSRAIVERRRAEHPRTSTFRSNIDGTLWYDIPLSFDPFWSRPPAECLHPNSCLRHARCMYANRECSGWTK